MRGARLAWRALFQIRCLAVLRRLILRIRHHLVGRPFQKGKPAQQPVLQAECFGQGLHAHGGTVFFLATPAGQNQLVLETVFPPDQFSDRDAVTL